MDSPESPGIRVCSHDIGHSTDHKTPLPGLHAQASRMSNVIEYQAEKSCPL